MRGEGHPLISKINPDGRSGILADGTEFISKLIDGATDAENVCTGCLAECNTALCLALPFCLTWDIDCHKKDESWIYIKKGT